ncbi:MAG TPA: large conductance mechanosensitive channel protein MscL [Acidobacteriota bacterium]|nr:large conductance mechanosensitive channel protein MscL [Acidobacteriota bacterium]
MLQEFKKFAAKGNMLDMAVGIVIGAAFATIIGSLVGDVIMPMVGLALNGADFSNLFMVLKAGADGGASYATLDAAKEAGAVTLNWGVFLNAIVNFLIIAVALFMVIRGFNSMKQKEEEAPAAPPAPSAEETLLTEIRDLLSARG